ncbi:transcription factor bHLH162-like isoform X2 [Musa acuminata AAA Group]|uniref:transcription factor bHLH162-like isoform X2 n=2 Tax=Musa acuminata AAA Group TaxID=214697 RepID=UPI0031D4FC17
MQNQLPADIESSSSIPQRETVMETSHGLTRPDRKTIEKNRRIHMKALYSKLLSLLPTPSSQEGGAVTLADRLNEAINYIKGKQEMLERMQKRKRQLTGSAGTASEVATASRSPKIDVQDLRPGLRVIVVISPCDHHLIFCEIVRVLGAEGVDIITASYAVVGDRAFHTIQFLAPKSGTGEADQVMGRLKKAIHA